MSELEAEEDFLGVGEIADDAAEGRRELLDERRRGEDPVLLGELGTLEDVDDLERVPSGEIGLADALEVLDRQGGAR